MASSQACKAQQQQAVSREEELQKEVSSLTPPSQLNMCSLSFVFGNRGWRSRRWKLMQSSHSGSASDPKTHDSDKFKQNYEAMSLRPLSL